MSKKERHLAERVLNAAACNTERHDRKRRAPKKRKIARARQIAQWKHERAVVEGLAEAGIHPTREMDEYHLRIALRGTTISPAMGLPSSLNAEALASAPKSEVADA